MTVMLLRRNVLEALPLSNASVERAFSIYGIIKSKLRNRLSLDMLQSLMMVRFSLQRDYGSCQNFIPNANMLNLFNVKMYDFKNQSNDSDDLIEIFNVIQ